jgi:hypothetical protein
MSNCRENDSDAIWSFGEWTILNMAYSWRLTEEIYSKESYLQQI